MCIQIFRFSLNKMVAKLLNCRWNNEMTAKICRLKRVTLMLWQDITAEQFPRRCPEICSRLKKIDVEIAGGTAALVALIVNNRLYVANVGRTTPPTICNRTFCSFAHSSSWWTDWVCTGLEKCRGIFRPEKSWNCPLVLKIPRRFWIFVRVTVVPKMNSPISILAAHLWVQQH